MMRQPSSPPSVSVPTESCSTRQAAEMLGVSLRTIQLWVDGGMLEAWKTVGGHRRVDVASVKRLAMGMESRPSDKAQAPATAGIKIVVAEDNADLLELYRATLESWNLPMQLITANNGFEALIAIGESHPDLLVTDLDMPGMDGFRMLQVLHNSRNYEKMRIVVVTGLDKDEVEARGGIPSGMGLYRKPVPFPRLRALVEEILAGQPKAVTIGG